MAPRSRQPTPAASSTSTPSSSTRPLKASQNANANLGEAQQIINGVWKNYVDRTPQRVKLIDAFMGFLVVVGALQFLYCVIVGNFVGTLFSHWNTVRRERNSVRESNAK
jgi:oligosaccharyltransferase complex subunit epsilon